MSVKQCWLPGGNVEITETIGELEKVGITRANHSPFNSPVWPMRKPDGTWRMMVDYWELKKVIPPVHAVVLLW